MRKAALIAAVLLVPLLGGCPALSQWFSEMASWRTGAGHSRQDMVNEYNSELQDAQDMSAGF